MSFEETRSIMLLDAPESGGAAIEYVSIDELSGYARLKDGRRVRVRLLSSRRTGYRGEGFATTEMQAKTFQVVA